MLRSGLLLLLLVLLLAACGDGGSLDGGSDGSVDAGRDAMPIDFGPDTGPCTTDEDGDGHRSLACGGDDCDDANAARYPGNHEVCDATGHDEDCNPATLGPDGDADGFVSVDCCNVQPSGPPLCGADCDDATPDVRPTAPEVCDGVDDDCDGMIDEDVRLTFFRDFDTDGFGDDTMTHMGCTPPTGYVLTPGDCNDMRAQTHPGAVDDCNGIDDDCNGVVDDAMHTGYVPDCDGDGYGAMGATPTIGCTPPASPPACTGVGAWVTNAGDCDDANVAVHPAASEDCNSVDDDCDGTVDGAPATTWCSDASRTTPLHEASATCTAGACAVAVCASGYLDCTPAAGCETPSTVTNCGACGHACRGWNGTVTCASGACTEDAVDVTAGHAHACALMETGAVACWGNNTQGALGDGSTTMRTAPVLIPGVSDAVEIASGAVALSTCARRRDGSVLCWGYNIDGQLGDGSTTNRLTPTAVSGLTNATNVAVGSDHACAVRADHTVVCWGLNSPAGGIGDGLAAHTACLGSNDCALTPVVVSGLSDAVEVVCGSGTVGFSCARRLTGAVVCWGYGEEGQLGGGFLAPTRATTPAPVAGVGDAVELAAGQAFVCARRATGAVVCWGKDEHGCLGIRGSGDTTCVDGSGRSDCVFSPTPVYGLTDAVELATGQVDACARRASGAVSCWGWNYAGMLGVPTSTTDSDEPIAVAGLADATRIAAGTAFSCALRAAGGVVCWGSNSLGALGDGTTTDHVAPAPALAP